MDTSKQIKLAEQWHKVSREQKAAAIANAINGGKTVDAAVKAAAIDTAWEERHTPLPDYLTDLMATLDPADVTKELWRAVKHAITHRDLSRLREVSSEAVRGNNWFGWLKSKTNTRWELIMAIKEELPASFIGWFATDLHGFEAFLELCGEEVTTKLVES